MKDIAKDIQARFKEKDVQVELDEIETRLDALINEFRVPEEEARRSVVNYFLKEKNLDRSEFFSGGGGSNGESGYVQVADIKEEGNWVNLRVKLVTLWDSDSPSIAQVGLLGDESGTIKFVNWAKSNLPLLDEDKSYELKGVVTDVWQGRTQVNLNSRTQVTPLEEDVEVGEREVDATGAVVDIQSGSGLVKRCPDCNRVLVKGACNEHGKVSGEYDLRVKAVVDDGMEAHDVLLNREMTEKVVGIGLDEAEDMAREALDVSVVVDVIKDRLIGRYYHVEGPVVGRYVLVEEMTPAEPRPEMIDDLITRAEAI